MGRGSPYWVCGSLLVSKAIGEERAVCTIHANRSPRILRYQDHWHWGVKDGPSEALVPWRSFLYRDSFSSGMNDREVMGLWGGPQTPSARNWIHRLFQKNSQEEVCVEKD